MILTMFKKTILGATLISTLVGCASTGSTQKSSDGAFAAEKLSNAQLMLRHMLPAANKKFSARTGAYPRTTNKNGELVTTSMYDWTPGFFRAVFGTHTKTRRMTA
ncbi:hypothetical protein [Niabella hibiscisoli]|uniref:hypothetical protein n=1 Tax=Niabella hibiscisoli TaxID=1825928 RepID=UPI001F0D43B9|nr:hypothetical protein [Niabella hibiscisoli]MCH5716149.1 hypothetical protein [Niabella hibiscisoli]